MNVKHFAIAVGLDLGLSLALLWVLGGAAITISAAPAPRTLSDATPVHYVAITGTDSGDCSTPAGACRTVQYAVDRAGEGDEVRVATGVYTGVNSYGGLTQVVYISKTVTVRGGYTTTNWSVSNPISHPTTLDAQGQGRVLYIVGYISSTLEGLRIIGGRAVSLPLLDQGSGGGVYVVSATITISGNWVLSNTALDGGGLFLSHSTATLGDNVVSFNNADGLFSEGSGGGGLYLLHSDVTLSNNVITSNTARSDESFFGGGGGLYAYASNTTLDGNIVAHNTTGDENAGGGVYLSGGTATLTANTISTNTANGGAGIYLIAGVASLVKENTIAANKAGMEGGGLQLLDGDAVLSGNIIFSNTAVLGGGLALLGNAPVLTGNTIFSNTAFVYGGGLRLFGSDARLVNNLVIGNQADVSAGGLYIGGSVVNLLHNTIARNTGGDGSGIFVTEEFEYSSVALTNTILVGHAVGITVTAGNTATLAGTLWGSDSWANLSDWGGAGVILTGTHNYWGDLAFLDPDAGDYHLGPGSAAIDAGVDASVIADIDGEPRPVGAGYDIGADEFSAALSIAKVANPAFVQAGAQVTFAIFVTNTGNVDLQATITDVLPLHIMPGETLSGTLIVPGGLLTWTALIPAPGGVWAETLVVTAEMGYAGPLTNVVRVATAEGAAGVFTATSQAQVTPALTVTKQVNPDPVQAGKQLTYILRITNTGNVDLHATITDVLPSHITPGETPSGTLIVPGGLLTWTALIPASGGVWAETLVVTAETGYAGPLTNVVRVATAEGATGVYTATSSVVLAPANRSPDAPSNPDPADGATGVPLTGTLQWQSGDPDGDPLTYTVSFGVSDPPPPVSQVQTASYDPGGFVAGTTYYWAVTASDGISSTAGPTWRFTTEYFVYLPVVLKKGP